MVNIVYLDDEFFSMKGGNKEDAIDLLESDLDEVNTEFNLFVFENGEDAISKIESLGKNTILILDMQMPTMNGAEVLEQIRKKNITCPAIGYSANKNNDKNNTMLISLLENDLFDYIERAEEDRSNLIKAINKAIEKFKDNIPLELSEALHEFLEKRPERKNTIIMTKDGKEFSFGALEDLINKKSEIGIYYEKALYKMSFEKLLRKEEKL